MLQDCIGQRVQLAIIQGVHITSLQVQQPIHWTYVIHEHLHLVCPLGGNLRQSSSAKVSVFFKTREPKLSLRNPEVGLNAESPCKKPEDACNLTRPSSLLVRTVKYPKPVRGSDSLSIVQMGSQGGAGQ